MVANTKIQKTAVVEEGVEKSENSFTLPVGVHVDTAMLKNRLEVQKRSI